MIKKLIFILILSFFSCMIALKLFFPIYQAEEIIITFGIHPFDICADNAELWYFIKLSFSFLMA